MFPIHISNKGLVFYCGKGHKHKNILLANWEYKYIIRLQIIVWEGRGVTFLYCCTPFFSGLIASINPSILYMCNVQADRAVLGQNL